MRVDKVPGVLVRELITWLPSDYFPDEKWTGWYPNVRSTEKLRKQWDALLKAKATSKNRLRPKKSMTLKESEEFFHELSRNPHDVR